MSGKVKPIEVLPALGPIDEVVALAESLLRATKSGEIRAFAYFADITGDRTRRGIVGTWDKADLVYGCEILKFDILREGLGEDVPVEEDE